MGNRLATVRRQAGFTLVELVIVLMLIGILGAWGTSMISDTFRTTRMLNATQAGADQARYAMERLAREIREVKYVDDTTGYAIASAMTAGATAMTFTREIGGADVIVTVNKSGNNVTLAYSTSGVTSTLSSQATEFTLDFLKLDNTAATLATDVRFVVITLTVTDGTSGQAIRERTRVALRNNA